MNSDGECDACGTILVLKAYLGVDGNANFALVCPNCDQIEPKDEPIAKDESVND